MAEPDQQRGSDSNDSIHAGAGVIRGGYVYATGNPHTNPFRIGTYDQQYPSNHNAFGLVDLFGFQNMKQDRLNLSLARSWGLLPGYVMTSTGHGAHSRWHTCNLPIGLESTIRTSKRRNYGTQRFH
jgi:hypothetical protein